MLGMQVPVILCFRAKEKIKIVKGQDPIDLGWQPIVGERVAFETLFTLMLPPYSQGIPDLAMSWMRAPFDVLVPKGRQLDEALGQTLAAWAKGGQPSTSAPAEHDSFIADAIAGFEGMGTLGDAKALYERILRTPTWPILAKPQQAAVLQAKEIAKQRLTESA